MGLNPKTHSQDTGDSFTAQFTAFLESNYLRFPTVSPGSVEWISSSRSSKNNSSIIEIIVLTNKTPAPMENSIVKTIDRSVSLHILIITPYNVTDFLLNLIIGLFGDNPKLKFGKGTHDACLFTFQGYFNLGRPSC